MQQQRNTGKDAGRSTHQTWLSVACMAELSPFVSLCLSRALLFFHSLLYLLFLMAEWRQGRKREWVRQTEGERRDEGDEEGRAPGKALMKSLWSLLWLSSIRVLLKRDQHLSEDMSSFPLPLHFSPFVSAISMWDLCLLSLLSITSFTTNTPSFSFTPCPLWSGHGSCLYLTNRGGPILLASGLWSSSLQDGLKCM